GSHRSANPGAEEPSPGHAMGCSTSREPTQPPAAAASAHLQERLDSTKELEERRLLRQVASCNKSAVSGPKERGSLGSNGENGEGNSSSYDGTSGDDDSDSESDSTSDRITVFRGHTKSVFPVIFVPADNMLGATKETEDIVITGSHDFTARTWGLYSGECLKATDQKDGSSGGRVTVLMFPVLKGHTAPINAMVVDTDGNILFTGGGDGVIRSWHIKTGDCQRVLTGHQGPIVSLI
ncbi:F-box and WD domain protein, putative, partial [Ixodes scapularis]